MRRVNRGRTGKQQLRHETAARQQQAKAGRQVRAQQFEHYISTTHLGDAFKGIVVELLQQREAIEAGRVDAFEYIANRLRQIDRERIKAKVRAIEQEAKLRVSHLRARRASEASLGEQGLEGDEFGPPVTSLLSPLKNAPHVSGGVRQQLSEQPGLPSPNKYTAVAHLDSILHEPIHGSQHESTLQEQEDALLDKFKKQTHKKKKKQQLHASKSREQLRARKETLRAVEAAEIASKHEREQLQQQLQEEEAAAAAIEHQEQQQQPAPQEPEPEPQQEEQEIRSPAAFVEDAETVNICYASIGGAHDFAGAFCVNCLCERPTAKTTTTAAGAAEAPCPARISGAHEVVAGLCVSCLADVSVASEEPPVGAKKPDDDIGKTLGEYLDWNDDEENKDEADLETTQCYATINGLHTYFQGYCEGCLEAEPIPRNYNTDTQRSMVEDIVNSMNEGEFEAISDEEDEEEEEPEEPCYASIGGAHAWNTASVCVNCLSSKPTAAAAEAVPTPVQAQSRWCPGTVRGVHEFVQGWCQNCLEEDTRISSELQAVVTETVGDAVTEAQRQIQQDAD